MNQTSEAQAIIDFAAQNQKPTTLDVQHDGLTLPLVMVPKGYEAKNMMAELDKLRDRPKRKEGTANLQTAESFVQHAKRHADANSALFASGETNLRVQAVYDYHDKEGGKARHGKHRAIYKFPISLEMQAWMANDGERMSQQDFAEFLEDRLIDVFDPEQANEAEKAIAAQLELELATPSKLLTLSRGLSVTVEHEIHQNTALGSGAGQLVFKERHKDTAGQPLSVPGGFLLAIPVFDGGDRWKLLARLRYRVVNQRVMWTYQLHKVREVIREAFQEAATGIALSTELPLFFGDPE